MINWEKMDPGGSQTHISHMPVKYLKIIILHKIILLF